MINYKMLTVAMVLALSFNTMTVSAAETETDDAVGEFKSNIEKSIENDEMEQTQTGGFDFVFQQMKNQLMFGEEVSFSGMQLPGTAPELTTQSLYDMSDMLNSANIDFGQTNMKFESLSDELEKAYGLMDMSGASQGCMNLFQNTYGSLYENIKLETPEIPKDFSVNSMLSSAQSAVDDAYSSVVDSSAFSSVKNSISIGDIFAKANEGLSFKQPMDPNQFGDFNQQGAEEGFSASQDALKDMTEGYKDQLKDSDKDSSISIFDAFKKQVPDGESKGAWSSIKDFFKGLFN